MATADFTIADVLAWVRTKPANSTYEFGDAGRCAVAQFGRDTDRPQLVGLLSRDLQALFGWEAVVLLTQCRTFGQLAKKLETFCEKLVSA